VGLQAHYPGTGTKPWFSITAFIFAISGGPPALITPAIRQNKTGSCLFQGDAPTV
jgi:hypothetical protein